MPSEITFGDYLWGGGSIKGEKCDGQLVPNYSSVGRDSNASLVGHIFTHPISQLLNFHFMSFCSTSIHVYIHIRIKDSTNILWDFSATCMLERKSLQQFKEEWLVKFPITYKVKTSNT